MENEEQNFSLASQRRETLLVPLPARHRIIYVFITACIIRVLYFYYFPITISTSPSHLYLSSSPIVSLSLSFNHLFYQDRSSCLYEFVSLSHLHILYQLSSRYFYELLFPVASGVIFTYVSVLLEALGLALKLFHLLFFSPHDKL